MRATFQKGFIQTTILLLLLLFVYTATAKLLDGERFAIVIAQSPFIGKRAVHLRWLVPVTEYAVALLLLIPSLRKAGLIASLLLLLLFSGYIASMLLWAEQLPCACGGVLEMMSWREHLLFNGAFIVLAGTSLYFHRSPNAFIAINRGSRKPV